MIAPLPHPLSPFSPLPPFSFHRSASRFTKHLLYHIIKFSTCLFIALRDSLQSVLLTETFNWNSSKMYETVELFLNDDLMCNYMLLPSMIGLRMAEELDLGIS